MTETVRAQRDYLCF